MRKSTFKLTKHELDFISDPLPMRLKQKIIRDIGLYLQATGRWVMDEYYGNEAPGFKVTRGENYLEMPYLVLDTPQLKQHQFAGKLRTMIWWGHHINLQYFTTAEHLTTDLLKNIAMENYRILINENLFDNDVNSESFIGVSDFIQRKQPPQALTKICATVPFDELHNLEKHIRTFMEKMHAYQPYKKI